MIDRKNKTSLSPVLPEGAIGKRRGQNLRQNEKGKQKFARTKKNRPITVVMRERGEKDRMEETNPRRDQKGTTPSRKVQVEKGEKRRHFLRIRTTGS